MNRTLFKYPCLSKYECHSIPYVFERGFYKVELWGSSGGFSKVPGGSGGYVSGYISFWNSTEVYLFIGSEGHNEVGFHSFNGGGRCQYYPPTDGGGGTGGGGTDIRLINSDSNEGLASRIIVAGGGGGAEAWGNGARGGDAGGLIGFNGSVSSFDEKPDIIPPGGGTQTSGGNSSQPAASCFAGTFGKGGDGSEFRTYGGGGGGGYFGGGGGTSIAGATTSGGGGSSFISGHHNCKAMSETFLITNSSIHYTGHFFIQTVMKDGSSFFHNPDGIVRQGNRGDGAIRITRININDFYASCNNMIFVPYFRIAFTTLILFTLIRYG